MERIVIKFIERPDFNDPEKMFKWFCDVFGLSSGNDAFDSIEEQILKAFAEAAHDNKGLASSELKLNTDLARSTVIYHLNRFIEVGLLVKKGRKYYLRASEMQKAIEEIEYDVNREMQRMLDTAKELDRIMEKGFSFSISQEIIVKKGKVKKGTMDEAPWLTPPMKWDKPGIPFENQITSPNPINQTEKIDNVKKGVANRKRKDTGGK
jgi:predicted transcriptional regulator